MGKFVENVRTIVSDYMDGLKEISVRTIRPKPGSNLKIEHPSGATIELKRDGKVYINGKQVYINGDSVDEIGDVQNPLTEDLKTDGNNIYDSTGDLQLKSSTGGIVIKKE